jgi:Zn-dependent M28 family amino/carboxypeptidase
MFRKTCCLLGALLLMAVVSGRTESIRYSRVGPEVIKDRLSRYQGKDAVREVTLARIFEEAGCRDDRLKVQPVPNAGAPNVICTLPGETGEVIVVGAHFDRVDEGAGVADNWSGASLLPSLYQSLSPVSRRHTFVFIGFSDEEEGLVGSGFYARQLTDGEAASITAMVDLDTLGLGPTEVWVSNSDSELVNRLYRVASAMRLPVRGMNVDKVGDSDGRSFKNRGIPVITLHTVTTENLHILHSAGDRFAAINQDEYYKTYNLIAGFLASLDQK